MNSEIQMTWQTRWKQLKNFGTNNSQKNLSNQIEETLRLQRTLRAALSMILYLLLSVNSHSFIRYPMVIQFF